MHIDFHLLIVDAEHATLLELLLLLLLKELGLKTSSMGYIPWSILLLLLSRYRLLDIRAHPVQPCVHLHDVRLELQEVVELLVLVHRGASVDELLRRCQVRPGLACRDAAFKVADPLIPGAADERRTARLWGVRVL